MLRPKDSFLVLFLQRCQDFIFTLGSPNGTPEIGFLDINILNAPNCKASLPTPKQSPLLTKSF